MKQKDCWMTFSEALQEYLDAREEVLSTPETSARYAEFLARLKIAADHMDALTECKTADDSR